MVSSSRLTLIGYWFGPDSPEQWPDPHDFVDDTWDDYERHQIVEYLKHASYGRMFMGNSLCRMCGNLSGFAEYTDGFYVWPEGLAHYVKVHGVRLPATFMEHAFALNEELEEAAVSPDWWLSQNRSSKAQVDNV